MYAEIDYLKKRVAAQGVTIGGLRRALRQTLAVIERSAPAAELHVQAWYREAKLLLLGTKEDA